MTRRQLHARVLASQAQLIALDVELDRDLALFRERLHPGRMLAGSFFAGFATIILPRRWHGGIVYALGSVAWPLTRLFAPTVLRSFLRNMDDAAA